MLQRTAEATWEGDLRGGTGTMAFGSGAFEGAYSFGSRFEEATGTNPEELIGAAHAGCFSMALAGALADAGHDPERIHTTATVDLERVGEDFEITGVALDTDATVPDIDDATFQEHAEAAKDGCPVSKVLAATDISLTARLVS